MSDQQNEETSAEAPQEPAYFQQFSRAFRESPEAKKLYGMAKLEDMAKAYLDSAAKLERAVVIPNAEKPDAEEVKQFRQKLAIPEKAEEYEIETPKGQEKGADEFKKLAASLGLSKGQAKALHGILTQGAAAQGKVAAEAQAARTAAFEKHFLDSSGGDAEKAKQMQEQYKTVLAKRYGDKVLLEELSASGLLQSPRFVAKVLEHGKLLEDDRMFTGENGGRLKEKPKGAFGGSYGAQWQGATGGQQ